MGDFYVYLHRRKDTDEVFYVGKGRGSRCYLKHGRNDKWMKVANKAGFSVEKIECNLTEELAFKLERKLIAEYGRQNLCNMTDGGEGSSGAVRSQQFKDNLSKYHTGRKKSDKHLEAISKSLTGKKLSEDTKEKLRKANTGRKLSEEVKEKIRQGNLGKIQSEESRSKMRKPKPDGFGDKIRKRNLKRGKIGPLPRLKCPHCEKEMSINNIYKFHFDNCKIKEYV